MQVFAKENLTLIIAVAGFVLSLATWIYTLITQRKSFSLSISEFHAQKSQMYMRIAIENKSRLPIAITRIAWITPDKIIDSATKPIRVVTTNISPSTGIPETKYIFSEDIPISIPSLGAISAYILFENLEEVPEENDKFLSLLIGTNRGKSIQMTLPLPEDRSFH